MLSLNIMDERIQVNDEKCHDRTRQSKPFTRNTWNKNTESKKWEKVIHMTQIKLSFLSNKAGIPIKISKSENSGQKIPS